MLKTVCTTAGLRRLLRISATFLALYVIGLTGWFVLGVPRRGILEGIGALAFIALGYVGALGAAVSIVATILVAGLLGFQRLRKQV